MDSKSQKQYTGTWIPAHVMEHPDLSPSEKILYAEIASFQTCYANNAHFAKRMGAATRTVQRALIKLEELGLVARFENEKDGRTIVALYDDPTTNLHGGVTKSHGGYDKLSPINNNRNNNKENTKRKISDEEKLNIEKLYRGWLIEMVIGLAEWRSAEATPGLRSSLLDGAKKKVRLTDKRHQKMLLRLRELGMENCIRAIKNLSRVAEKNDFYKGNNDSKWKASIEWLFNSTEKTEEWANK